MLARGLRAGGRSATRMATEAAPRPELYRTAPLHPRFGVEVRGVDLSADVGAAAVDAIRADVARHRLLVFRDQGVVSGARQVEIARWFGELESTFYKHPRSPHPDVFRVSNDPAEGCTGVGRTGWHVDGSFQRAPFSHALYHIVACTPRTGATAFAPLGEVLAALPPEARARWERLSMLSDRRSPDAKPLVYSHPATGRDTLLFHTGMIAAFVWDAGTPRARATDARETAALLEEIEAQFRGAGGGYSELVYAHAWRPGDFIIADNAALGHEATPETQRPRAEVGLRVMHRCTLAGTTPPRKSYRLDEPSTE